MLTLALTWIGAVLGITVVLLMALGPVIVELDGWLAQRRRERRREAAVTKAAKAQTAAAAATARPVFH